MPRDYGPSLNIDRGQPLAFSSPVPLWVFPSVISPENAKAAFTKALKRGVWIHHGALVFGMELGTEEPGMSWNFHDFDQP